VKALYFNTFHKEYRNRAIIFLAVITVVVILTANALLSYLREEVLAQMSVETVGQNSLLAFYYVIGSWSSFIAIYIGIGSIKSDIDSGALIQLLSFPISRTQYFLTRILGSFSIVILYYLLSLVLAMILFSLATHNVVFSWGVLGALLFSSLDIFFVILLSAFIAIRFGTLKTFVAVIFMLMIMSYSSMNWANQEWQQLYKNFGIIDSLTFFIYWLLPRLKSISDFSTSMLIGKDFPTNWWGDLIHYFGTTLLWSTIFVKSFSKSDL